MERITEFCFSLKDVYLHKIKENPLKYLFRTIAAIAIIFLVYQLFSIFLGSIIYKICLVVMPLTSIFTASCCFAIYYRKSLDNTIIFIIFSSCFGGELLAQSVYGASSNDITKPTVIFIVLISVSATCILLSLQHTECIVFISLVSFIRLLCCTTLLEIPIYILPYLAYISGFSGVIAAKYVEMLLQPVPQPPTKSEEKAPSIRRRRSNSTAPPCVVRTSTAGRVGRRTSLPAMIPKVKKFYVVYYLMLPYGDSDYQVFLDLYGQLTSCV